MQTPSASLLGTKGPENPQERGSQVKRRFRFLYYLAAIALIVGAFSLTDGLASAADRFGEGEAKADSSFMQRVVAIAWRVARAPRYILVPLVVLLEWLLAMAVWRATREPRGFAVDLVADLRETYGTYRELREAGRLEALARTAWSLPSMILDVRYARGQARRGELAGREDQPR